MKIFIWNAVRGVSNNYHDNGAIVAIAPSLDRARQLIAGADGTKMECEALTTNPDLIRDCDGDEYVAIHPDAGCC